MVPLGSQDDDLVPKAEDIILEMKEEDKGLLSLVRRLRALEEAAEAAAAAAKPEEPKMAVQTAVPSTSPTTSPVPSSGASPVLGALYVQHDNSKLQQALVLVGLWLEVLLMLLVLQEVQGQWGLGRPSRWSPLSWWLLQQYWECW